MWCQETANAAGTPSARPRSVDPVATIKLLSVLERKSLRPNSSTKFSSVGVKMSRGGIAATSVRGLKAERKVQAIGTASTMSTTASCTRIRRFEELPSHHATALRSRANTSTEPSTMLDSVTMMALA